MAIDVGAVRVGVASSDETETVASPLVTLERKRPDKLWQRIGEEIAGRQVATLVVGLPRKLDGSEGSSAADARDFAGQIQQRFDVAIEFWDERFTSAAAERALVSADVRRAKRRLITDAVAACLILQDWLDARSHKARRDEQA